ncbi:MAG: alpha-amylase [Leptolyngbyaceae cyanobacterium bins.59]|nr:alpha-amylase [Leptolyngbyaceae cyanobacterium bins.59]
MAELNGTIMQYFHWYTSAEGTHWNELKNNAKDLARAGFTALWLPPAYKASGGIYDVGYAIYDLFDLGEFDQKGNVRTKYGTRDQYVTAVKAAQAAGIHIYADAVLNHKNGGDAEEEIEAIPVAMDDRNRAIGGVEKIKSWTQFSFPGRGDKYSNLKWHWWHFDSVNHNMYKPGNSTIYRFAEKQFETQVDPRNGNYDFLMACDLDINHPEVRTELKRWGEWVLDTTGVDGFRLDAIKHIQSDFFNDWLDHLERYVGREVFTVGEYWADDIQALKWYIHVTGGRMSLFDVSLHYNFHRASRSGGHYDMRRILDGTLMQQVPTLAVTFVENHDSQPLQALESVVEAWFKPLAYALILLRREGYPCVFYADYYGAQYRDKGRDGNDYDIWLASHRWLIDKFLYARRNFAYGPQYDYFDHPNTIGWTRLGTPDHPRSMAVLMSDGPEGWKWMEVGKPNTTFRDLTEHVKQPVRTNQWGWGEFRCKGGSVSVWIEDEKPLSS